MKSSSIFLTILVALTGTACTQGSSSRPMLSQDGADPAIINREGEAGLPMDFSLLEIGRSLSRGAVDIYDPWLTVFRVTPPEHSVPDPLAGFPHHPTMVLRDDSVEVYTLQSDMALTEQDAEQDRKFSDVLGGVAPPLPLVEEEVLEP